MERQRRDGGFTLIEIMLVVTIIGILAAVVLPRLVGRSEEARISATRLQVENLNIAIDAFELDSGKFPKLLDDLFVKPSDIAGEGIWKGPYLKKKISKDPWGTPYNYKSPGDKNKDYDVWSSGPDAQSGNADDIGNWIEEKPGAKY